PEVGVLRMIPSPRAGRHERAAPPIAPRAAGQPRARTERAAGSPGSAWPGPHSRRMVGTRPGARGRWARSVAMRGFGLWEHVLSDLGGRGRPRLVLQPLLAMALGIRFGIADARAGATPFLL